MNAVDKVIQIAENEVGYLEKKSNRNLYDKTANAGSNNYTKYWAEIKPEYQGAAVVCLLSNMVLCADFWQGYCQEAFKTLSICILPDNVGSFSFERKSKTR